MRIGLVRCAPDASLRDVARLLAGYGLHSVAVLDGDEPTAPGAWAIITARDVARAAWRDPDTTTARELHAGPAVTVAPDTALADATRLMARDRVTHLLVLDPASKLPVAVLSTLDVAARL
ncbi:MAG TPA: CBS domain-containing protein [Solirubrobacteraceae bacterium]|jgi:CBS domain-containing protein